MKRVDLSFPALLFVVVTRGILGAGVGLLAAGRFRRRTRRYVGGTLAILGALATIPAVLAVSRGTTGKETKIAAA